MTKSRTKNGRWVNGKFVIYRPSSSALETAKTMNAPLTGEPMRYEYRREERNDYCGKGHILVAKDTNGVENVILFAPTIETFTSLVVAIFGKVEPPYIENLPADVPLDLNAAKKPYTETDV